jgi:DNA-binding NarL/FixJ family response regulator
LISALLAPDADLQVVTVGSLPEAERAAARIRPDVLVVALTEPALEHPAAIRAFRKQFGSIPVMVISCPVPERVVTELIKAGASGYLFSDEARFAGTAVRELARGGSPMSSAVSRVVLGRARRSSAQMAAVLPSAAAGGTRLTSRQQQILELLAGGHSYDDIGLALDLSVNTVRSHVKALYERLGASTKVEAVLIGLELRLLTESGIRREPSA